MVEILDMKASVEDLEAALGVLMSDDKDLIEVRHREGGQITGDEVLLDLPGMEPAPDLDPERLHRRQQGGEREETRGRVDCGLEGVTEDVSSERFRGIRIFDISDLTRPLQVGAVQTCRGSHTHSVVAGPGEDGKIIVYNSGTSTIRDEAELDGCGHAGTHVTAGPAQPHGHRKRRRRARRRFPDIRSARDLRSDGGQLDVGG